MTQVIELRNSCVCDRDCAGAICQEPVRDQLADKLAGWRLRNPSFTYRVISDARRHDGRPLIWDPERTELWDLLAADGDWRQAYSFEEESLRVLQTLADDSEESFIVEPVLRSVPLAEPKRVRLPALVASLAPRLVPA